MDPTRRAVAEGVGSALLLAIVIGSGIMGERLSGGNVALALLANTLATGAGLAALILTFQPISGAHFNPVVSLVETIRGRLPRRELPAYVGAQFAGALLGVAIAHVMFGEPLFSASRHERSGLPQLVGELVATFGLLAVVLGCRASAAPFAVGAYIASAYWFTSSTSFANPAVTLARAASDTFAGIRPADVPGFVGAQLLGALGAAFLFRWLQEGPVVTVVFACVHNAGRSQMAAAWFNRLANPARARAVSAGTEPGPGVHAVVQEAMREAGFDLAHAKPQRLADELVAGATLLVTMGCGEACPFVPGLEREDWPLEDPKGQSIERVREIRDDARDRVVRLLDARQWR